MWQQLRSFFAPEALYRSCGKAIPLFALIGFILLSVGWVWGFGFAPADYQQGNSFRIIYIHVPAAIWSMATYAFMAIAALVGLIKQSQQANMLAAAMAPVGAVFTFIALTTGAIWGKPMWGTWWVWDARLTSELVLFFLYIGAIALYNSFDDRRVAAKAAGILVLVGVVNLPIIHYSVEWWNTLHQGSTKGFQTIAPAMRTPLRWAIYGYMFFFITLTLMRLRNLILESESKQPWVNSLINKGGH
jgi:heme exporter protein C